MSASDDLHPQIELAKLLAERLERLSVDSRWARRSSGMRGSLLRTLEVCERGEFSQDLPALLDLLTARGFEILENAAKEIPIPDDWRKAKDLISRSEIL
jgi:hypothetical protein